MKRTAWLGLFAILLASIYPVAALACITLPASCRISSPYGMRIHPTKHIQKLHAGVDIACPAGTPVKAAHPGTASGQWTSCGGNMVVIQGSGFYTRYFHNSLFRIPQISGSKQVNTGEVVSDSGNTGECTTGPHIHFEYWSGGTSHNPMEFVCGAEGAQQPDVVDAEDNESKEGFTQVASKPVPGYTMLPPNPPLDIDGSLMQALQGAIDSKFSNPVWYQIISVLPKGALLSEIAYMKALHLWASYQKMQANEYIQATVADMTQLRVQHTIGKKLNQTKALIESQQ